MGLSTEAKLLQDALAAVGVNCGASTPALMREAAVWIASTTPRPLDQLYAEEEAKLAAAPAEPKPQVRRKKGAK